MIFEYYDATIVNDLYFHECMCAARKQQKKCQEQKTDFFWKNALIWIKPLTRFAEKGSGEFRPRFMAQESL